MVNTIAGVSGIQGLINSNTCENYSNSLFHISKDTCAIWSVSCKSMMEFIYIINNERIRLSNFPILNNQTQQSLIYYNYGRIV